MDDSVLFMETDEFIVTLDVLLGEPILVVREKGNLSEPYPLSHQDTMHMLMGGTFGL